MVLLLGVGAALAVVLAEVSTLYSIDVETASCTDLADPDLADACDTTGGEQHSYALIPLALLVAVMAVGAGLGGSRPAGFALLGAGVVVLGIALLADLPDTTKAGEIGANFAAAEAVKGTGFWLELAGGLLASLAGALRLADRRGERPTPPSRH